MLKKLKIKLEETKCELREHLEEVEREGEQNKTDLQSVEGEITQNETFDTTETLLKTKEDLVKSRWNLKEKKHICEKQLTRIENCLSLIKIQ